MAQLCKDCDLKSHPHPLVPHGFWWASKWELPDNIGKPYNGHLKMISGKKKHLQCKKSNSWGIGYEMGVGGVIFGAALDVSIQHGRTHNGVDATTFGFGLGVQTEVLAAYGYMGVHFMYLDADQLPGHGWSVCIGASTPMIELGVDFVLV